MSANTLAKMCCESLVNKIGEMPDQLQICKYVCTID